MEEKSLGDKRDSFDKAPTDLGRKMAFRLTISTLTLVISVPEFIELLITEGCSDYEVVVPKACSVVDTSLSLSIR